MSNKAQGFGFSKEIANKIAAKYDQKLYDEANQWIFQLTGKQCESLTCGTDFHNFLKDGTVLCEVINAICPGSVKKINTNKMAFKQMENIGNFLSAATAKLNIPANDLFQTVDLFEDKNMNQVVSGIHALGRGAQKIGFDGPVIGVKIADKNVREFDEATLNAGKAIPSQQMGNNKGASQAGSTAPGLGRQVDHMTHNNLR